MSGTDYLNATPEEKLAYDITYALSHSRFRLRKGEADSVLAIVGQQVVEHLKRSGWTLEKKQPLLPSSTPTGGN